jgi:hypothetical protein
MTMEEQLIAGLSGGMTILGQTAREIAARLHGDSPLKPPPKSALITEILSKPQSTQARKLIRQEINTLEKALIEIDDLENKEKEED